jgi:hypothetical protein
MSRKKNLYWNPKNHYFKERKIFKQIWICCRQEQVSLRDPKCEASNKHNSAQKIALGKYVSSIGIAISQN